jgi:NitT/TauT family transport system ATP-binding protein
LLVDDIRKSFTKKGAPSVEVIDGVSFSINQGELVSLLGPSGCGKTTLLRIVAGLETATSGGVTILGRRVTKPQPDFGMVFQTPVLMPWRTALDNVLYPMEVLHRNGRQARERAMHLLELVGLTDFADRRPRELSGGMQQRVSLCRALIHEPALLLMDEPFGALDELTRLTMNDLLLELRTASQATVVFVTHSIPEAIYLSDRVLVLSRRPCRIARDLRPDFPYPRQISLRHTGPFNELEIEAEVALGLERRTEK